MGSAYNRDELPDRPIGERPHQPSKLNFPKRNFGSKSVVRRSFQPQWFQKWPWLHYDEVGDSAFCSICVQAARSESLTSVKFAEPSFITRGFSNWKDASGERGAFNRHESSICHKTAFEAVVTLPKTTKDVGELLSVQHAEEKAVNRKNLLVIAENIKFLARQGLELRGMAPIMTVIFISSFYCARKKIQQFSACFRKKLTNIPLLKFKTNFFKSWL